MSSSPWLSSHFLRTSIAVCSVLLHIRNRDSKVHNVGRTDFTDSVASGSVIHTYSCCHTRCSRLTMTGQCLQNLSHAHTNMVCRPRAPASRRGSTMQPMSRGHVCKACGRATLAGIHCGLASGLLASIAAVSLQLSGASAACAETYVDVQNDIPLVRSDYAQTCKAHA